MKRKRLFAAVLALSLLATAGCKEKEEQPTGGEEGIYTPGTYEGTAAGFGTAGVKVTITVDANTITDVTIEGKDETPAIGGEAMTQLAEAIKTAQSADIDGVSGATLTSNGVKEAAQAAIAAAKGEEKKEEEVPGEPLALTPGTYEGTATGFHGPVTVSVEVTANAISKVTVGDNDESWGIGTRTFSILEGSIVDNQSLADAVTGATISSRAVTSAVENALKAAGATDGAIKTLKAKEITEENPGDTTTDVVVVGGGVAGMMAAASAHDNGANVILLEKNSITGGSALLSAGAILSIGAQECVDAGIEFTADDVHRWYSIQAGPVNNDPVFYEIMNNTKASVDYMRTMGYGNLHTTYNEPKLATNFRCLGGEHFGISIIDVLDAAMAERNIDLRCNSTVTGLVMEGGKVTGVTVESRGGSYTITAEKVILATGGYTYNDELMKTYAEGYENCLDITASGATGDGHIMGVAAGGHIIGEGVLQMHTVGSNPFHMGGVGAPLYVDEKGTQLGAMDEYYGTLATKIHAQPNDFIWGIYSSDNIYVEFDRENGGMRLLDLEPLVAEGKFIKADTIEELAEKLNMEPAALARAVEEHNWFYDHQFNDSWGTAASALSPLKAGPYYAAKETFCVMGTVAGLEVNTNMQVLDANGQPIDNLYAVGELVFGNVFNQRYPMSGTAIGICVTSGMLAGENVAEAVK